MIGKSFISLKSVSTNSWWSGKIFSITWNPRLLNKEKKLLYSSEKAVWMALEAIQCLGGNGYTNEYPTGRLLRDAKLYDIGAGTNEIRRMLIGREIFKKNY